MMLFHVIYIFLIFYLKMINSTTHVDQECCENFWKTEIGPMYDAMKKYSDDLNNPEFMIVFNKWNSTLLKYINGEVKDGICDGLLNYKCLGQKCKCNDNPPFNFKENFGDCIASEIEELCYGYLDSMKCGPGLECIKNPTKSYGPFDYCMYSTGSNGTRTTLRPTIDPGKETERPQGMNDDGYKLTGWIQYIIFILWFLLHL